MIKNKFEALSVADEESDRKDKDNLERVVTACIEDPDIPWKKVTPQKRKRATEKKTRNKTTTRQFARKYMSRKYMSERDSVHF